MNITVQSPIRSQIGTQTPAVSSLLDLVRYEGIQDPNGPTRGFCWSLFISTQSRLPGDSVSWMAIAQPIRQDPWS